MTRGGRRLRACVIGHSFVRRLRETIAHKAGRDHVRAAPRILRVDDTLEEIYVLGKSGYTLSEIRNDVFYAGDLRPDVVFINCGSNHLCDTKCDVDAVANGLISFANLLRVSFTVSVVVIMGVVKHDRCRNVSPEMFKERAYRLNGLLQRRTSRMTGIVFEPMRGFLMLPRRCLLVACHCLVPRRNPPSAVNNGKQQVQVEYQEVPSVCCCRMSQAIWWVVFLMLTGITKFSIHFNDSSDV